MALTYNRVSHVVMMATPADLEDFAVGFSITEGLVGGPEDILSSGSIPRSGGIELAMTITEDWFDRLATQRRNMAGRTGCGLCGAENIEQALRIPAPVSRVKRHRRRHCNRRFGTRSASAAAGGNRAHARGGMVRSRMATFSSCARTSAATTRWTS